MIGAGLLAFLTLTHLGVIGCFALGTSVPRWLAPAALGLALAGADLLARREQWPLRVRLSALALSTVAVAGSLVAAAWFYDFGWDGQWYHQNAVYQMARGWNPLREPMRSFAPDVDTWLRHYTKGPWYVALALFRTTGDIECGKAQTSISLVASLCCTLAVLRAFGRARWSSVWPALAVALNPVVVGELMTDHVDGLVASSLACFAGGLLVCLRRPAAFPVLVAVSSGILCINAKQTGLVYVCIFAAGAAAYLVRQRPDGWRRSGAALVASLALGAAVFGYNPYVTNTLNRGHPFYPWAGTAAHPGFDRPGRDPNERYEMPRNLVDHNRVYRLAYSVFSRPGIQPLSAPNAELMWPFGVRWSDFVLFQVHAARVGGLGPLFSGALLISLVPLGAALVRPGAHRLALTVLLAALLASLLVGAHGWWARYVPQLWWAPLVAALAGAMVADRRWVSGSAATVMGLLLLNASLIGLVHVRWEMRATQTLRRQLEWLRRQEAVRVDLGPFQVSYGERLRAAGVRFEEQRPLACPAPLELMTVVPGYPGTVRACVHGNPHGADAL